MIGIIINNWKKYTQKELKSVVKINCEYNMKPYLFLFFNKEFRDNNDKNKAIMA